MQISSVRSPISQAPQAAASFEAKARRLAIIVTAAVILTGLALRLIGLSYPPFDAQAFRQTETLSTIEAFHRQGIDLFHPKTLYMGYPGTFVLELPVFQAMVASLYDIFGPHLEIIRLLNILFGAGTAWLLYWATRRLVHPTIALLAFWIYWLAPLNILYQRSMLIDPMAVFCAMASFYSLAGLLGTGDFGERRGGWLDGARFAGFAVGTWLATMMKALYLWPAVLLFGWTVITRRFKLDRRILAAFAAFAVSGICFLFWNSYAGRVNGASPFVNTYEGVAGGFKPTSHLGFSALLSPGYYYTMFISRPKWWLGILGAALYPIGLLAAWKESRRGVSMSTLWLPIVAPPTYLLAFANINAPHEFYQLIITPFLAIVAAYGLRWLGICVIAGFPKLRSAINGMLAGAGAVLVAASILTYCVWFRAPRLDPQLLKFQQICAGRFEPWTPAMIFVSWENGGLNRGATVPGFLYASKLWGFARTVHDNREAQDLFKKYAPVFPQAKLVLFYGLGPPAWLPKSFHLVIQDGSKQFYVFRRSPSH